MEEIEIIKKLTSLYKKFPTVGSKSAKRLAYSTLSLSDVEKNELKDLLEYCNTNIKKCNNCGIYYEDKCPICSDEKREKDKIIVVSDVKDVYSIENTNIYKGLYFTLKGLITPLKNLDHNSIGINDLQKKVEKEKIKEIIIALPTSLEGETTSMYISHLFKNTDILVTRIAYGIPVGTNLEYLDQATISRSLSGRIEMKKD